MLETLASLLHREVSEDSSDRSTPMETLDTGDRFPTMSADAVDGSHFTLPGDVEGIRAVIVFYRGHW